MPGRATLKELLRRYGALADEYARLVKVLRRAYTNAYGGITLVGYSEDTDAWVTCTGNPLVRHHIGCTPGLRLHLRRWSTDVGMGMIVLDFDRAWAPGMDKPINVYYYTGVSGPVGLTALYSAGLGWALDRVLKQPHARILGFLGRVIRGFTGVYEPSSIMYEPSDVILPRGVGIINNTLVISIQGSNISINTGGKWDFIYDDDLAAGGARGYDGVVSSFIESMYDALAGAYDMALNIAWVLGLA